ncbi:thiolase family protein [Oceanivirga miroungae]|uniref:Acetyl-CoA acetyltransferase n=1 Tax=Oceanivirga miroungae TaxID=1130046 RepID=A0A6I8MCE9_9FUSO|nr:thiolase family protein [Oceanivirga miroungae]VWL84836.1 Acetyl-CoA acetyltransferase [Oceanivirga miroungae]
MSKINNKVAVVAAKRSPIGVFKKTYKDVDLVSLSSELIDKMLKEIKLDKDLIDEVIVGTVLQGGRGQNIARQIEINAKISNEKPAYTVDMVCGSSMKAINLAKNSILVGESKVILVGGVEFMSDANFMYEDGLFCSFSNASMGITAENIVEKYKLKRSELDKFSLNSTKKAIEAQEKERFKDEIVEIFGVSKDEFVRLDQSIEKLGKLKPVFKEDGIVTAGNSTGLNDGASFLVLMEESYAKKMGFEILAYIDDVVSVGLDPNYMGLGPIYAIDKLIKKNNIDISSIDLFEINEAFAAQALVCINELDIDEKKVNVNGGAIALGHPLGATGARIVTTLIYEMRRRKVNKGIASLCIGGGQGMALLVGRD